MGETFRNFPIKKGDLLMGDRGYGSIAGINYVINNGGDFLVRIRNKAFNLMKNENEEFCLLENFRKLDYGEIGDFDVLYKSSKDQLQQIRLCVIKKSPEAAERSKKTAIQDMKHKQRSINEETIELHGYMFVITSVNRNVLSAVEILSLYRMRWQVE
ncbi:MAG: transposase, partial [Methanoregula sp.]|nr:transposase [Methanoregula sp.]